MRPAPPPKETALAGLLREIDHTHLRPSPEQVAVAKDRATRLVEELHRGPAWMFTVRKHGPHGSVSRRTALNQFNDLDWKVELDPDALRTTQGQDRSAKDTISRLASAIRARRAGLVALEVMSVRPQNHSVGVGYHHLRIDLVPLIRHRGTLYIPERETGDWIATDPEQTADRLIAAKARVPHAGIAVRLRKAWRRARGRGAPIASFALETWVVDTALRESLPLDGLLRRFYSEVGGAHKSRPLDLAGGTSTGDAVSLVDPVSGLNLTSRLLPDDRKVLIDNARRANLTLDEIQQDLSQGREARSRSAAIELFVGRRWR